MGKKHQRHILWTRLLLNEVGDVSEALEEAFKICERKQQLFSCVNDVLKIMLSKKGNKNVTYFHVIFSLPFSTN